MVQIKEEASSANNVTSSDNEHVSEFSFTTDELLDELYDLIIDRSEVRLVVNETHLNK